MTKVKFLIAFSLGTLEEMINNFIKDKRLIDLHYTIPTEECRHYSVLIVYEG